VKLLGFGQRAEPSPALARKCPGLDAVMLLSSLFLGEPPDAIKHVRWRERGRL
jgi:hypothetical protein